MRPASLLVALFGLAACGGSAGPAGFTGGMGLTVTVGPAGSSTSASGSSSTSAAEGEGSSTSASTSTNSGSTADTAPVLDMAMPDFDPLKPAGCQGKIDFLFVISSQGTMKPMQERLLASFPGFITAIEDQLPNFDLHILVAKADGPWQIGDCSLCTDDCDPQGVPPFCGASLTPCDNKIGAGVTFPAGVNASNRRCELAGGLRYISSGQQDMNAAFACVAQVGTYGAGLTGQGMVNALQPTINEPDNEFACNGGFLRDDALLVVTIIQDTYDSFSVGTVTEWIEALRAAKKYDDDAFMVLVLTTDVDVDYHGLCLPNEYNPNKNRLRLLAEGVKHGFIDSICRDNYALFFAEHVAHLVDLCDDFVPPG